MLRANLSIYISMVTFPLLGERLWIDLVNTELVDAGTRVDLLRGFDELVDWYVGAGVLTAAEARAVRRRHADGVAAPAAHRQAIELRGLLRAMAEGLAAGRGAVAPRIVEAINALLPDAASDRRLVRAGDRYQLRVRRIVDTPAQLLAVVAESAATTLADDDLTRLRACQNPGCLLFFYDTTKNGGRRWCSMAVCGNRAKVAAHYRRGRPE